MRKDCVARELTIEMIVGAFMVMIFLGLAYFTIILSRETWFTEKTTMEVVFDNVMGLREGDNVVVRGMPVGKIRRLELMRDGVHVVLMLDQPLSMRNDYVIRIVATSVLGGHHLTIDEGTEGSKSLPDGALIRGQEPRDLISDASDLVGALRAGFVEGGVVSNLQSMARNIDEIVARVHDGKGLLGRILSDDDTLYTNLTATIVDLRKVVSRIEQGQGALGKLLSADDTVYGDLQATMQALRKITERVESGEGTAGKLLAKDDRLYQDLAATVTSVRNIVQRIEKGDGLLGKLATDETLYNEVKGAVGDVRAAIDDMRETSPIVTFSSVFFGAF